MHIFAGFCAMSALFYTGNTLPLDYSQWDSIDQHTKPVATNVTDTAEDDLFTSDEIGIQKRWVIAAITYAGMFSVMSLPMFLPWILLKDKKNREEEAAREEEKNKKQKSKHNRERDALAMRETKDNRITAPPANSNDLLAYDDRAEKRFWGTVLAHIVAGIIMAPVAAGILGLPGWLILEKDRQEAAVKAEEEEKAKNQDKRHVVAADEKNEEQGRQIHDQHPSNEAIYDVWTSAEQILEGLETRHPNLTDFVRRNGRLALFERLDEMYSPILDKLQNTTSLKELKSRIPEVLESLNSSMHSSVLGETEIFESVAGLDSILWHRQEDRSPDLEQVDDRSLQERFGLLPVALGVMILFATTMGVILPMTVQVKRRVLSEVVNKSDVDKPAPDLEIVDDETNEPVISKRDEEMLLRILSGFSSAGLAEAHMAGLGLFVPMMPGLRKSKRNADGEKGENVIENHLLDLENCKHISPRVVGMLMSLIVVGGMIASIICVPRPGEKSECDRSLFKRHQFTTESLQDQSLSDFPMSSHLQKRILWFAHILPMFLGPFTVLTLAAVAGGIAGSQLAEKRDEQWGEFELSFSERELVLNHTLEVIHKEPWKRNLISESDAQRFINKLGAVNNNIDSRSIITNDTVSDVIELERLLRADAEEISKILESDIFHSSTKKNLDRRMFGLTGALFYGWLALSGLVAIGGPAVLGAAIANHVKDKRQVSKNHVLSDEKNLQVSQKRVARRALSVFPSIWGLVTGLPPAIVNMVSTGKNKRRRYISPRNDKQIRRNPEVFESNEHSLHERFTMWPWALLGTLIGFVTAIPAVIIAGHDKAKGKKTRNSRQIHE